MLQITEKQAIAFFRKNICEIFLLFDDGTESAARTVTDISTHIRNGGKLGVEERSISGRLRWMLKNEQ